MKNHVILINHAKGQIETHEVDIDKFLEVWDLLHPDKSEVIDGLSFGAAQRVEQVQSAVRRPTPIEVDDIPQLVSDSDPVADAMANSSYAEPELEEPKPKPEPKPEPVNGDAAFMASLQSLFG